jgi:hypothetical protein
MAKSLMNKIGPIQIIGIVTLTSKAKLHQKNMLGTFRLKLNCKENIAQRSSHSALRPSLVKLFAAEIKLPVAL